MASHRPLTKGLWSHKLAIGALLLALFTGISTGPGSPGPTAATSTSLEFELAPKAPTSADLVKVQVGEGSDSPRQARRVYRGDSTLDLTDTFFGVVDNLPPDRTFTLGALLPGHYKFLLFQKVPDGGPGSWCSYELVDRLRFSVQPYTTTRPAGSGRLELHVRGLDRGEARALVESKNPQADYFELFNEAAVTVIPGLEVGYAHWVRDQQDRETWIPPPMHFPECGPPRPGIRPGSFFIDFSDSAGRQTMEQAINGLPPEMTGFRPFMDSRLARVEVEVLPRWEPLFRQRYLNESEVAYVRIKP